MKRFELEFNKQGQITDASQVTKLLAGLDGVTDLLVVSHGWNNDMADACALYDKLLGNVDRLLALRAHAQFTHLAQLAPRVFAACQLFWPSKKFTEEELIPGEGAVSVENGGRNDAALETVLDRLAENPDRLGDKSSPPVRKELVRRAKELIPKLERSERARDVIAKERASGPIIVTHTKNDRAVGIAYPLASRVAFQKGCALGDANDPYGGMGRNGALRTVEVSNTERTLKGSGHTYSFEQGAICNLLADEFISDHGAVDGPEVAYTILSAARALQ